MRKLIFILMFLFSLFAREAFADCRWTSWPEPEPVKDIILPARTIIKAAPIGQELAKHKVDLWSGVGIFCEGHGGLTPYTLTATTAFIPSALPRVYETGIKGVGVKFCLATFSVANYCAPASWGAYGSGYPRFIEVVFVRTGRSVASGNLPMNFNLAWTAGGNLSLLIRSQGATELVNDVFFAGCESMGAAVNVQMGKQTIQHIKNGSVREVPFNFDVRCDGLKPDTKVPVKVYFEGNSQADGMLKLSNLGQPGVASGVGISLVNDKGVKLPFDITRSVALDWNREVADGSVYRFTGKAKYTPTGGEIKPGKGDATMSFVINYN
ncbi:fimbrial protein [Pseudomonas chlororaphis]|uniref:fimbrial protein n=1 Tax=Pseudomonas chlororaphis TaxID=587753 RepID=UPI000F57E147|nr:fimbrial protein [Pseudomonas chlororaphis]